MKLYTIFFALAILLSGCGYKPSSYYAKNEIVGKVFVDSKINIGSSENSIIIKDAMNEMVINRFNGTLVDKQSEADTIVIVKLLSANNSAIATDDYGYTKMYRMTVKINIQYKKSVSTKGYKSITVSNYYDYSVVIPDILNSDIVDTISTDRKKEEAKKLASINALSDIFSKIAVQSFKK
ncbi:MAG: hypothetical protein U9R39_03045 [Campylobacterota bacterium]|nr:hypothetical protein [Campylobacterota bacterium]